jgi:hypothetical protein
MLTARLEFKFKIKTTFFFLFLFLFPTEKCTLLEYAISVKAPREIMPKLINDILLQTHLFLNNATFEHQISCTCVKCIKTINYFILLTSVLLLKI